MGVRGGLFESPDPLHEGHSHEIRPCRPRPALSRHALYRDIRRGFSAMKLRGILCELTSGVFSEVHGLDCTLVVAEAEFVGKARFLRHAESR